MMTRNCTTAFWLLITLAPAFAPAAEPETPQVSVVDGVVMPRRPVAEAISHAMQFLKKADGGYVPGRIDRDLAGYFTSAFVLPDGGRSDRPLAYPARQHAYFIFTFLRYHAYTGEREWLVRARDLADWNLALSTPADARWPDLPYSTTTRGRPGGGRDENSIEPDKAAFLGTAYLWVHEATGETKYLAGARKIADTLARTQRDDGGWPFRVVPEDGRVLQEFGGAPVFFVEFFEHLSRHADEPAYRRARDQALAYMLRVNVEKNAWGTYHEDIRPREESYLSAEPMSFTATYLFRNAAAHPEYLEMGRRVLRRLEEKLVHTTGHAASPAPAVAEQAGFNHIMPGHTARYCRALAELYAATGDRDVQRRALSGVHAVTYMQSPVGLFRTFFHDVRRGGRAETRPDWYSQHLYTVCHVLEVMPHLPELAPDAEDHLLAGTSAVSRVEYTPNQVRFETRAASETVLKLAAPPSRVVSGSTELPELKAADSGAGDRRGWRYEPATRLLTLRHGPGEVSVTRRRVAETAPPG